MISFETPKREVRAWNPSAVPCLLPYTTSLTRQALGCTHAKPPGAATWHHVLRQLDGPLLEAAWGAWADSVLAALPPAAGELAAIALDGTTLRGRRKPGAPAVPRLAALSHRLGRTMGQQAVADKPKDLPAMEDILRGLVLEGRVLTVEAWLTPRRIAHHVGAGGWDDVMIVQGNQPPWPEDIGLDFQEPSAQTESLAAGETVDQGHGRLEDRRLTPSPALMGYRDWPGLAQGFHVERRVTVKKSGAQRAAVVDGVTRLSPERASPAGVLRLVRQHWPSENTRHGVQDVTFDTDRSPVRSGSMPQVMAAVRHTAMGLRHWAGQGKGIWRRLAAASLPSRGRREP